MPQDCKLTSADFVDATAVLVPMLAAVSESNVRHVQRFVREGCSLNVRSMTGLSPLMLAVQLGNMDCVALLWQGGADAASGVHVADEVGSAAMRALVRALAREDFDTSSFAVACGELGQEARQAVECLFGGGPRQAEGMAAD